MSVRTCGTPLSYLGNMLASGSYDPGFIGMNEKSLKALTTIILAVTKIAAEGGVNITEVINYLHNEVDINNIMENMDLKDIDLSKFIPKE